MTAPLWTGGKPGSSWQATVRPRFGDELEAELRAPDGMQIVHVLSRRDVAALADALYRWLRESPPGRGGVIVDPYEFAELHAALALARDLECERGGCGHRMGVHGIGSKPERPSPCSECLCPRFR